MKTPEQIARRRANDKAYRERQKALGIKRVRTEYWREQKRKRRARAKEVKTNNSDGV